MAAAAAAAAAARRPLSKWLSRARDQQPGPVAAFLQPPPSPSCSWPSPPPPLLPAPPPAPPTSVVPPPSRTLRTRPSAFIATMAAIEPPAPLLPLTDSSQHLLGRCLCPISPVTAAQESNLGFNKAAILQGLGATALILSCQFLADLYFSTSAGGGAITVPPQGVGQKPYNPAGNP
eukprot:SM000139S00090  [mRNA]  locus=s139:85763:86543:+ [translate_table: standard]